MPETFRGRSARRHAHTVCESTSLSSLPVGDGTRSRQRSDLPTVFSCPQKQTLRLGSIFVSNFFFISLFAFNKPSGILAVALPHCKSRLPDCPSFSSLFPRAADGYPLPLQQPMAFRVLANCMQSHRITATPPLAGRLRLMPTP